MKTDRLIERLAEGVEPVRPLPRPWVRSGMWLALAVPYVVLVVLVVSPRDDLADKLSEWHYLIEQVSALVTGIAAATAAFATIIPGYNRKYLLLPLLPLTVWLASLGQGFIQDWIEFGLEGLTLQQDWFCLPATILVGAVPAITMAFMLRQGAPLTPHFTTALGGLAAAGLGNFGLRLFHPQDVSLMVLVWQFGTVFFLSVVAGWVGHFLLNWQSIIGTPARKTATVE